MHKKKSIIIYFIASVFNLWTEREREWYNSEKRLLFALQDRSQRDTWFEVLKWIIDFNKRKYEIQEEL